MTEPALKSLVLNLKIPAKLQPLYLTARYKILYGGRGSGKSIGVADFLLLQTATQKRRVLCAREYQSSIKDSVHRLLAERITALGLERFFVVLRDSIRSHSGSEFIFKGLHHNITEIKSMAMIDFCWIEEAERVSDESWDMLIPTIREEHSEIIITFNPSDEHAATYTRFVENTPPNSIQIQLNYYDNPFFPNVLRDEMEYDRERDFEKFNHVWLGKPRVIGNHIIFANKYTVKEFETPERIKLLFGNDWGFAVDPTVLVRCFVINNDLYIDYEAYGVGVENNELGSLFHSVPLSRNNRIYSDCARPETISYMSNIERYDIVAAKKWAGSVEDGIQHIKGYKNIFIHPRCKHVIYEMGSYSYKRDKTTGDILSVPVDKNNHCIDALRYALNDKITQNRRGLNPIVGFSNIARR